VDGIGPLYLIPPHAEYGSLEELISEYDLEDLKNLDLDDLLQQ